MTNKLTRSFYARPSIEVSQNLLGKYIVRKIGKKILSGKIIETEAYIGPKDRASHAYNGKRTKRNEVEFLEGGYIYIYLVYGMYWQLNITTGKKDFPECVLVRALDVGEETSGPGKLCNYLKLDKSFYGEDLTKSRMIWVEGRKESVPQPNIISTPRIGIDYAGPYWSKRKLRLVLH